MSDYISRLREAKPLIHCITNIVAVNSCANALLAIGAKPIMAVCPEEIPDIVGQSDASLLNIGTITDFSADSIRRVMKISDKPVVLDCVGASASRYRRDFVRELIEIRVPDIIKGNASEIAAVCTGKMSMSGVDSASEADINSALEFAKAYNTTVSVTGREDLIFTPAGITAVQNGCEDMSRVTGTGCITGCLMAAFLTVTDSPSAAAEYALVTMGICGELAKCDKGFGTFYVNLLDALSKTDDETINKRKKVRFL